MARLTDTQFDRTDLDAYNGTFWDLGFRWQWDPQTYRDLCVVEEEQERVRSYIVRHHSHLLAAYDGDFLAGLIVRKKAQRHAALLAARATGQRAELTCAGVLEA